MTIDTNNQIESIYKKLQKQNMTTLGYGGNSMFSYSQILTLLPQRDPFLFVDKVFKYSTENNMIIGETNIEKDHPVFTGHFPGKPILPGVIQVEIIGQMGIVLGNIVSKESMGHNVVITHVVSARFIRQINGPCKILVFAQLFEEGLFFVIVGQCVTDDAICSTAIIKGIKEES